MKGFINEFRTFITKGNAIDLAVGIIIGTAFGGVVNSLVKDVVMPPLGVLLGGVDFSSLAVTLQGAKVKGDVLLNGMHAKGPMDPVYLKYGMLINAMIALMIQGFAVFLIVKGINALRRKPDPVPATPAELPADIKLLTEIRDSLRTKPERDATAML